MMVSDIQCPYLDNCQNCISMGRVFVELSNLTDCCVKSLPRLDANFIVAIFNVDDCPIEEVPTNESGLVIALATLIALGLIAFVVLAISYHQNVRNIFTRHSTDLASLLSTEENEAGNVLNYIEMDVFVGN